MTLKSLDDLLPHELKGRSRDTDMSLSELSKQINFEAVGATEE